MALISKKPALCTLSKMVVIPKAHKPSGAGLAVLSTIEMGVVVLIILDELKGK
ncbi:hypothetical protein GCM10023313_15480 [Mucilaginibacter defluvii]|uniref:Uncharacterized protein n=1 Tax=Mucilaginibacter defluvii TaxID=1196019 RepID=A0ABP9FRT5_9SPHI